MAPAFASLLLLGLVRRVPAPPVDGSAGGRLPAVPHAPSSDGWITWEEAEAARAARQRPPQTSPAGWTAAAMLANEANMTSAASFLQLGTGRKIPVQQKFDMKCLCSKEVTVPESGKIPVDIPIGKCAATEAAVKQEETGNGMTVEEIKVHIGNPLKLSWAKVPKHHFSAVDGRTSHPVLGTPGGDLGEWVIALSIYEGMTNRELGLADVKRMLKEYLRFTTKMSFYYHTDRTSTEKIGRILTQDRLDLTETPQNDDIKSSLLQELVLPSNVGSEHFRMMLEKWHKFNVRKELVVHCIHSYFEILWDKVATPPVWQKLRLVTVEGQSMEKAFVKIDVSPDCVVNQVAPLIRPRKEDNSIYVAHKTSVQVFRKEMADFFADSDSNIDAEKFLDGCNELGDRHLEKDIEYLARSSNRKLPVYEVKLV